MWEFGVSLTKELAKLYEHDLFDYKKLSEILKKQAGFFDKIISEGETRPSASYFYVGFWGLAFHRIFQNRQFIFRGNPCEMIMPFRKRMLNRFPRATILPDMKPPCDEIKNSNRQYLQIAAVKPFTDMGLSGSTVENADFFAKDTRVNWRIRQFYESNEVSMFSFTSPKKVKTETSVPGNEFADLWAEKITFATRTPLPNMLRWCEIPTPRSVQELSPLDMAIDSVKTKNTGIYHQVEKNLEFMQDMLTEALDKDEDDAVTNDLDAHVLKFRKAIPPTWRELQLILSGVLEAAVQGGIPKYEEAFLSEAYSKIKSDEETQIKLNELKSSIADSVPLLEAGLVVHEAIIRHAGATQIFVGNDYQDPLKMHDYLLKKFEGIKVKYETSYGKRQQKFHNLKAIAMAYGVTTIPNYAFDRAISQNVLMDYAASFSGTTSMRNPETSIISSSSSPKLLSHTPSVASFDDDSKSFVVSTQKIRQSFFRKPGKKESVNRPQTQVILSAEELQILREDTSVPRRNRLTTFDSSETVKQMSTCGSAASNSSSAYVTSASTSSPFNGDSVKDARPISFASSEGFPSEAEHTPINSENNVPFFPENSHDDLPKIYQPKENIIEDVPPPLPAKPRKS